MHASKTIDAPLDLESVRQDLEILERKMHEAEENQENKIRQLHSRQHVSARNLIRYLALRGEDIRSLQENLHVAGLSSLASSESHILRQLQAIRERLGHEFKEDEISGCTYQVGRGLIRKRAAQLFGPPDKTAIPYLMVTFDAEFADHYQMVKKLLEAGMRIARINCAHDDETVWKNMIFLIHQASEDTGIPCKIYMDLAGPKMRTVLLGKGRKNGKVSLMEGQQITLAEEDADYDPSAVVIGCNEANVIRQLQRGERVLFDDGLVETVVESNKNGLATCRVVRISSKKSKLKASKGMNFPETELDLPGITERDRALLPFICQYADLVGYSFVRDADGVRQLQDLLSVFERRPQIILKIETPQAVMNFPSLLLQGMQEEVFGVMIARGDLAVEIGFERMSEIQEEISWISEAGHVPVIWATQVLETLNKSGVATRSEVTDASHAAMAECVMINKGDHTIKVMRTLSDILQRSGAHHLKKRYTFRPMQIARDYFNPPKPR